LLTDETAYIPISEILGWRRFAHLASQETGFTSSSSAAVRLTFFLVLLVAKPMAHFMSYREVQ
jgi:hypothetical protein